MKDKPAASSTALLISLPLTLAILLVVLLQTGPSEPSDSAAAIAQLESELRALRLVQSETAEVLEQLASYLASTRLPVAPSPLRSPDLASAPSPVMPSEDVLRELSVNLAALTRVLRQAGESTDPSGALSLAVGESLSSVRDRRAVTDWVRLDELGESWRQDERGADRSQYFQTARDLLETYGPPTAIYRPDGGLLFYYRQGPEDLPGPAWYFRLQDGIVIEFFMEHEEEEQDS